MKTISFALLALVLTLLVWDYSRFGRSNRRLFNLELLVLCVAGTMALIPGLAQSIADFFEVGRGVDAFIYPVLIWLVREAIVARHRRWMQQQKMTSLAREIAIREALSVVPGSRLNSQVADGVITSMATTATTG